MKKRIIGRLDIKKNKLIKGVHLEGLRVIGDPSEFAHRYYSEGIDELLLLDSVASLHGRNALSEIIKGITSDIFIPITVGGGINSIEQVKYMFESGADKITINTNAIENPNIISEISSIFGSQALTLSIQIKRIKGEPFVMSFNGRERTNLNMKNWIIEAQDRGIGELMVTSIDQEGTMEGFDLELLEYLLGFIKVPIICSGGIASSEDAKNCFNAGAHAVAIASAFHFSKITPVKLKEDLKLQGFSLR